MLVLQIVRVYVEVFVERYAHAIWIFVVFWSDLVAQLKVRFPVEDEGFTTVGSSSGSVTGSWMITSCTCGPWCTCA